jgi:DNA helicase II / ATP-dependent DNA helicase PcrA
VDGLCRVRAHRYRQRPSEQIEGGDVRSLAVVDYKTSTDDDQAARDEYDLQLAVYTNAGGREGLDVRAAYVHDLKAADRRSVDVSPGAVTETETLVEASVDELRKRNFAARPGRACKRCDLKRLCRWDATSAHPPGLAS